MAIPQKNELAPAFQTARQLKEKIEKSYISKSDNIYLKKDELKKEIIQFAKSNQEIINRYIENQTTTEDIVLAEIMRQFLIIHKIIESYEQPRIFFHTNKNNLIAQLENHLKLIKEELNKLSYKSEFKQEHQAKSPAPAA